MKVQIRDANNLTVICGRVGYVDPKLESLTSVSIANKIAKEGDGATEWCHITFSNPREGMYGQNWATFAKNNIKKGMFLMTLCYQKQNGEYTNYYNQCCNDQDGMFLQIPKTDKYCVVGKIKTIANKSKDIVEVTVNAKGKDYKITFMNNENSRSKLATLTSYFEIGQTIGLVVTKKEKDKYVNWYANMLEFGPKPIKEA